MGGFIAYVSSLANRRPYKRSNPGSGLAAAILLGFAILLLGPAPGLCKEQGYTQKGAFRVKKNAENMLHEIESSGTTAFMLEKTVKGKPFYIIMAQDAKGAAKDKQQNNQSSPRATSDKNAPVTMPASTSDYRSSSAHMLHDPAKSRQATDANGRLVLSPLSKRMSRTLALSTNAEVLTSPEEGSLVIGRAGELGALWYVKSSGQWHTLWLGDSRYGYVKDLEGVLVNTPEWESPRAYATQGPTHSN